MKTKSMKTKTMKTKSILSLTCGLVLLCLGGQANAALTITNGDFQDLTGLTAQGGGWYNGVPTGWSSTTPAPTYNVVDWNSGNFAANLQTLSTTSPFHPLYQSAGLLSSTGDVTLTFNIVGFDASYNLVAAIYNAPAGGNPSSTTTVWTALAVGEYNQTSGFSQTLTALNVVANTPIAVAFWSSNGVGVDAVNVIPEPSTGSMMALGFAGLVTTRLLRRKNS